MHCGYGAMSPAVTESLGIYVHIPFCRQKCSYCDFVSYQGLAAQYEPYVEALLSEIALWVECFPESVRRPVDTIYFGGGTPTRLPVSALSRVVDALRRNFRVDTDAEVTTEANPGEIDFTYLKGLREVGFNRLSYGIQTFDDDLLGLLRRTHTAADAERAVTQAIDAGFSNVCGDLIYALPGQTEEGLLSDVDRLLATGIHHVSVYGLQVEAGTLLDKQVRDGTVRLLSEDEEDRMYDALTSRLVECGFERYEISNFTDDASYGRHNMKYWRYEDYLGFGVGAHSFYGGVRRGHVSSVPKYVAAMADGDIHATWNEVETIDEARAREDYSFLALRTAKGIDATDFERRFGVTLRSVYGDTIESLVAAGLVETFRADASVRLTAEGMKHGNYVFSRFIT